MKIEYLGGYCNNLGGDDVSLDKLMMVEIQRR